MTDQQQQIEAPADALTAEHATRLAAGNFAEKMKQIEKDLMRPGGLFEQLETAQRETEERLSRLENQLFSTVYDPEEEKILGKVRN